MKSIFSTEFELLGKFLVVVVLGGLLIGCDNEDDLDLDAPTLTITSPSPGDAITIDPAISITGETSSDTTLIEATQNSVAVPSSNIALTGTTFTVDVTLENNANEFLITASDATGNSRSFTFTLFYPMLSIPDGASASLVLGQPNYTVNDPNQGGAVTASTLNSVAGTLFKRNNSVLYVPDSGNHRVLGFNSTTSQFNEDADFVVGQADLSSSVSGTSATRFNTPTGVYATDTQFFVVDQGNNRVLIWDSIPSSGSVAASTVIGQIDMTTGTSGCTDSSLNMPSSVFVVGGKVVVSDTGNNRVLIWNTIPAVNGAVADIVIGQTDMMTCLSNGAGGVVAENTLSNPGGIWTDGIRLLVADTGNHRVLVWNDLSTLSSGQAADWVLGQADRMSASVVSPPTASSLNSPLSVSSNGNQIFVADTGNNRVLGWDTYPIANGSLATTVIGQTSFTSSTTVGTTESEMMYYDNVFVAREGIYVVDRNRILRFSEP